MADNTTLPGTGDVYGADDISGVKYQRVKLIHGIDGVNDGDVSSVNALPVISKGGFVSTNNSTIATLTAASVFTGTGEDVSNYSSISVLWTSDQVSGTAGLSMEFSTDNSNWDRKLLVDNGIASGTHKLSVIAKYFRVVLTNGGVNQTSLRLQTLYHSDNSLPLVSRLNQQLNLTQDCALVRPISPIELDLAREQITGQEKHFFFGYNDDIDAAVWEDIWANGGNINWLTAAGKIEVLSSDVADTSSGLGLRSVEVHGLSTTGVDQKEVIAMNGTSAVESALTYIRVNKVHSEEVGTYGGSHKGDITCRVTGGGAILSLMKGFEGGPGVTVQYGSGEGGSGFWSVPLGKVAYLTGGSIIINTTGVKTADVVLYERDSLLDISTPFIPRRVLWSAIEAQGRIPIVFKSYIKLKSLTDIFFRAQASANNTKIEVYLEYYLLDANTDGA